MYTYLLAPALAMTICLGVLEAAGTQTAPQAGTFVWNELATTNVQAAKDFYNKVFGWEYTDKKMDDMTYTIIKHNGKDFGGIWAIPSAQQSQIPPHWLAYILVEDVNKSLESAKKNGATILKPIQQAGDMGRFAIIQDPTGAHIALWQPLKK